MSAADKNMIEEKPVEEEIQPVPQKQRLVKVKVDKRAKSLRVFSIGSTILFVAIVLVINLVFESLLGPTLKWDFTPTATYTLGDTTKTIVSGLKDDIRIVALFDRTSWSSIYSSFLSSYYVTNTSAAAGEVPILLDDYVKLGAGRISVEYIDPVKVPGIVAELDPDGVLGVKSAISGSYVVIDKTTNKSKIVGITEMYSLTADSTSYSYTNNGMSAEQAFSGAIQFVAAAKTPVVYFVTGHSEADYASSYSNFAKILSYNNFATKSLDIRTISTIPADAAMLAFLDPQIDISPAEKELLTAYVKGGGRLLVIAGYSPVAFPTLNSLLALFNIQITTDRLREGDTSLRYGGDPYTFVAQVPATDVSTQSQLILGGARRLEPLNSTDAWITATKILTTSAGGISEANGDANSPSAEATQVIGMASENKGWMINDIKSAKVIVLGSSALISDAALTQLGDYSQYNRNFIYYNMEWLIDASKNSLYIQAKTLPSYTLNAGNATSYLLVQVLVVGLIPLGLLLAAFLVFRRRRHL